MLEAVGVEVDDGVDEKVDVTVGVLVGTKVPVGDRVEVEVMVGE